MFTPCANDTVDNVLKGCVNRMLTRY